MASSGANLTAHANTAAHAKIKYTERELDITCRPQTDTSDPEVPLKLMLKVPLKLVPEEVLERASPPRDVGVPESDGVGDLSGSSRWPLMWSDPALCVSGQLRQMRQPKRDRCKAALVLHLAQPSMLRIKSSTVIGLSSIHWLGTPGRSTNWT